MSICKKHKTEYWPYVSVDVNSIPRSILDELSGNVHFLHVADEGNCYVFNRVSACGNYMITFCVDAIEYDIMCADGDEDCIEWDNETYYKRVD